MRALAVLVALTLAAACAAPRTQQQREARPPEEEMPEADGIRADPAPRGVESRDRGGVVVVLPGSVADAMEITPNLPATRELLRDIRERCERSRDTDCLEQVKRCRREIERCRIVRKR